MSFWTKNGVLVGSPDGVLIDCDHCPCEKFCWDYVEFVKYSPSSNQYDHLIGKHKFVKKIGSDLFTKPIGSKLPNIISVNCGYSQFISIGYFNEDGNFIQETTRPSSELHMPERSDYEGNLYKIEKTNAYQKSLPKELQ